MKTQLASITLLALVFLGCATPDSLKVEWPTPAPPAELRYSSKVVHYVYPPPPCGKRPVCDDYESISSAVNSCNAEVYDCVLKFDPVFYEYKLDNPMIGWSGTLKAKSISIDGLNVDYYKAWEASK